MNVFTHERIYLRVWFSSRNERSHYLYSSLRRWAKSTLILVPLFGIHYTIFLPLSYLKNQQVELVWLFCDQLFASFQVLDCREKERIRSSTHLIFLYTYCTIGAHVITRLFAGYLRRSAVLHIKRRSQDRDKTYVENAAVAQVHRLLHLRPTGAVENFAGWNLPETASIGERGAIGRQQFRD